MEFRLFGTIRGVRGVEEVDLGSPGQKALLALLALEAGRLVTVDRLIDALWGDDPPSRPVHMIRVYVSRLRRVLESDPASPELVLTEPRGYRLAVDESAVDVVLFRQLAAQAAEAAARGCPEEVVEVAEEALDLWTEEPLAELSGRELAESLRRRLEPLRANLIEDWAEAQSALGGSGPVVERLEVLVDADPYRERAWELLALALYRRGRPTEALRSLRRAREMLEEIGLEPGPGLVDLEESVFRQDPALLLAPDPQIHNLPVPLDRFVGRQGETAQLVEALARHRLVTVTGPGGSGKTRMAVEVARGQIGKFRDGVWVVDLAPVEGDQLASAVLEALGGSLGVRRRDAEEVARRLRGRSVLLFLDNCEHLGDPVAQLVAEVLRRCPEVRILATSREALRVPGELLYRLPPLELPDPRAEGTAISDCEAVALFLERAESAGVRLEADNATMRQVARIVRRLDGIPLAIELAAGRLAVLPVAELADRVDDVFSALGMGPRTAPPRHRTLQAAFDWSYHLLPLAERRAFASLSLLRGDFDLSAATALIGEDQAAASIDGLVAKSMLTRVAGLELRYRLLEPLRQFGIARLEGPLLREASGHRDRHFRAVAEEMSGPRAADHPSSQARFLRDRHHLEASLHHLLEQGAVEEAAAIALDLHGYWIRLGFFEEGRSLVEGVLASPDRLAPEVVEELLLDLAWLLVLAGRYAEAKETVAAAEERGCEVEDLGWSNLRGTLDAERGYMRSAERHLTRGSELARGEASPLLPALLINLSAVTAWMGEVERSAQCASEASREAERSWPTRPDAFLSTLEGIQARMVGDLERAEVCLATAVREFRTKRADFHLGLALIERSVVCLELGEPDRARELVEEAWRVAIDPEWGPVYTRLRGKHVLARAAWEEGDATSAERLLQQMVEEATASDIASALAEAGDLAAAMALVGGDEDRASTLTAATSRLRGEIGLARDPHETERARRLLARVPAPPADPPPLSALLIEMDRTAAGPSDSLADRAL